MSGFDSAGGPTALAAVSAAAAAWLCVGPGSNGRGHRAVLGRSAAWGAPATLLPSSVNRSARVLLAGALLVAAWWVWVSLSAGESVTLAVPLGTTAAVATGTGTWLSRRARAQQAARRLRADVVEACEAISAGLRAGLPPERVLARTAEDVPVLVPSATAARLGADVASALCARLPPGPAPSGWRCLPPRGRWARRSGAGLAAVVSRIAAMVRADAGRQRQVDAALGGARATARLFAVLPLLGVALGMGMDADPLHVLTATPAGAWCLCAGTTLAAAGLVWVERLADGAAR